MEKFNFIIRIYDKNDCCIHVCRFIEWDDAFCRFKELERENPADSWYIELSQVMRRNKR